jgi:hypothetical protein
MVAAPSRPQRVPSQTVMLGRRAEAREFFGTFGLFWLEKWKTDLGGKFPNGGACMFSANTLTQHHFQGAVPPPAYPGEEPGLPKSEKGLFPPVNRTPRDDIPPPLPGGHFFFQTAICRPPGHPWPWGRYRSTPEGQANPAAPTPCRGVAEWPSWQPAHPGHPAVTFFFLPAGHPPGTGLTFLGW